MHFAFCCCRSNRSKPIHVSAALAYCSLLACAARWHQSIHLHHTVFGRRMFTSDVRIPEFWIHISSARHFASTLTPASAITRFTVTSFVACDKAYYNLHDRFLVLFVMSFLHTQILICKCSNIPTSTAVDRRFKLIAFESTSMNVVSTNIPNSTWNSRSKVVNLQLYMDKFRQQWCHIHRI